MCSMVRIIRNPAVTAWLQATFVIHHCSQQFKLLQNVKWTGPQRMFPVSIVNIDLLSQLTSNSVCSKVLCKYLILYQATCTLYEHLHTVSTAGMDIHSAVQ